jgi:hypothetical protein
MRASLMPRQSWIRENGNLYEVSTDTVIDEENQS